MTVQVAPTNHSLLRSIRSASSRCGVAALVLLGFAVMQAARAAGETRTISFHHTHTKEDLTITYKVNGRYDDEALKKINHLMRDWRENQPIKMDPELIDLLWEVHRETGSREPIWVVCGYRSPGTNSMLRSRSSGVAKASQHMLGKAIDFYIPGVSIDELRAAGLRAQRGGVGYYSSSSFVHMDTGSVRHWPRMPDQQLANILAKGQLASHNASDGRSTQRVNVAQANVTRSSAPNSAPSFLSKLFGGGDEHESDAEAAATTTAAPAAVQTAPAAPKIARAAIAARAPEKATVASASEPRREKVAAVPVPQAKPVKAEGYQVASAGSVPVKLAGNDLSPASARLPVVAQTDSVSPSQEAKATVRPHASANNVFNDRGYWQGLPSTDSADAGQNTVARSAPAARRVTEKVATASVAPWPMNDRTNERAPAVGALGYAPQGTPTVARTQPSSAGNSRITNPESSFAAARSDELALLPSERKGPEIVQVGDRFNDPWMRAMMVSPSAQRYMRTTLYGAQDFRSLGPMLAKPASVISLKFADDPTNGMSTDNFGGSAVAFIPTVNFVPRTAALR